MSRWFLGLTVGGMVFALWCIGYAQEPAKGASWELRAVPGLSAKARTELAKTGLPIWHTVQNEGYTLRKVVAEVCGDHPPEILDALLVEAARLNLISGPDTPIEKDIAIAVPFCLKVQQNVPVEIKAGDTLEKILNENYGVSGQKTLNTVYKGNKAEFGAKTFDSFAANLPVGKEILVPKAEPRVFTPRPDATQTALAAADGDSADAARLESLAVPVAQPADRGGYQFDTIQSVEFESAGASCAPAGKVASIVDFELLKERFTIEEQAKRNSDGQDAQTVVVGIVDSGLAKVGDNFFKLKFLSPNPREVGGAPDVDDEPNDFVDDVYGINFNTRNGEIRPYATSGDMKSHGTKMASLVLGGTAGAVWADSRTNPAIQLKIVNFASSEQIEANMDPTYLSEAIAYLATQGTRIINMSLANAQNISGVTRGIAAAPNVLFVVAAGNAKQGPGRNIDLLPQVFPARYGGRNGAHRDHVITVGAADLTGKRAAFSNYSRQYVDLLAPGCAVQTRTDVGDTILDNGTSPATAIVSFGAALVSSLGLSEAKAIKNRLLLSTDPDPTLIDTSWSSGRLNLVKAISLRNDVIALETSGYSFSKVNADKLKGFCADKSITSALRNVRKLVANIPSPEGTQIEFWTEIDGILERTRCLQDSTLDGGRVTLSDGTAGPSLEDIEDITFASF